MPLPSLGKPIKWSRLNLLDWFIVLASLACCTGALASVYHPEAAAYLGQTNQLVLLGLLLGLMALLFQGRAQKVLAALQILKGSSSIQNLEAITQMEILGSHKSVATRTSVSLLLGLPLGLSIAYKQFTGGIIITRASDTRLEFGPTPPPGTTNIGWGLSLFASTVQPWWSDPRYPSFYGYSLATLTGEQTALLDSPLEADVARLRGLMRSDQYFILNATVAAVEATMVADWYNNRLESMNHSELLEYTGLATTCNSSSCTSNEDLLTEYFACQPYIRHRATTIYATSHVAAIVTGTCKAQKYDNSFMLLSRNKLQWQGEAQQDTFFNGSQAFTIAFQRYVGSWNITSDAASLVFATRLDPGPLQNTTYNFTYNQELAIEDTYYDFEGLYNKFIPEYEWRYPEMQAAGATTVDYSAEPSNNVISDATWIAAMFWSRFTTKIGPTNHEYRLESADKGIFKYTQPASVEVYTQTLRRHWGLAFILGVFPILTLLAVVLRATSLADAPISNGFGLVSILAAMEPNSLVLMRGAGLSGAVERPVRADFFTFHGRTQKEIAVRIVLEDANGPRGGRKLERRSGAKYY